MSAYHKIVYFIVLLLFYLPVNLRSQTLDINLEQFSIEDGLSLGHINFITQDSMGFIWLATKHGLNRYDGYEFKQYLNYPSDPNSISDNQIEYIFVDKSGALWICTINGLNKYDKYRDHFIRFKHNPGNPNSLPSNSIKYICQDKSGNYWILSREGDICKIDKNFEIFEQFKFDYSHQHRPPQGNIYRIYLDRSDNLWIASSGIYGDLLSCFYVSDKQWQHFKHNPQEPGSLGNGNIRVIYQDRSGIIWVGADGLNKYNEDSSTFTHFKHNPEDPHSLGHNDLNTILEDCQGEFWIGTARSITKFDHANNKFYNTKFKRGWIWHIYEDKSGVIWIATNENTFEIWPRRPTIPLTQISGILLLYN